MHPRQVQRERFWLHQKPLVLMHMMSLHRAWPQLCRKAGPSSWDMNQLSVIYFLLSQRKGSLWLRACFGVSENQPCGRCCTAAAQPFRIRFACNFQKSWTVIFVMCCSVEVSTFRWDQKKSTRDTCKRACFEVENQPVYIFSTMTRHNLSSMHHQTRVTRLNNNTGNTVPVANQVKWVTRLMGMFQPDTHVTQKQRLSWLDSKWQSAVKSDCSDCFDCYFLAGDIYI